MIFIRFKLFGKTKNDNDDNSFQSNVPELTQLFAPDRVKEYEDHLRIDDMYCRVLVVEVLPELLCFGWFNAVTSMGGVTVNSALCDKSSYKHFCNNIQYVQIQYSMLLWE